MRFRRRTQRTSEKAYNFLGGRYRIRACGASVARRNALVDGADGRRVSACHMLYKQEA